MDLIIQKVVELGATEVIPVNTARSQKWMTSNKAAARFDRWRRIALEAARQSGRNRVPVISSLVDFSQVTRQGELSGLKLIFWEEEALFRRLLLSWGPLLLYPTSPLHV